MQTRIAQQWHDREKKKNRGYARERVYAVTERCGVPLKIF